MSKLSLIALTKKKSCSNMIVLCLKYHVITSQMSESVVTPSVGARDSNCFETVRKSVLTLKRYVKPLQKYTELLRCRS